MSDLDKEAERALEHLGVLYENELAELRGRDQAPRQELDYIDAVIETVDKMRQRIRELEEASADASETKPWAAPGSALTYESFCSSVADMARPVCRACGCRLDRDGACEYCDDDPR